MKYNRLIKIFLVVAMGSILIFYGVDSYEKGVGDFIQMAKRGFEEALRRELLAKNIKVDSLNILSQTNALIPDQTPKTVYVIKETGREEYHISAEKNQRNITKDANMRILHSIALEEHPIVNDTLYHAWQQRLKESDIEGRVALCVSVTGDDGRISSSKSTDYVHLSSTNLQLFNCNLGYLCEVEITGYVGYTWWFIFWQYVAIRVLPLFVGSTLFYFLFLYFLRKSHHSCAVEVKEVLVTPVQLVKDMPTVKTQIYKLSAHSVFDASNRQLIVEGQQPKPIALQRSTFLELLLNAEGNKLEDEVLMKALWSNDSGTNEKLNQVASRLRDDVKIDPSISLVRVALCGYQLLFDIKKHSQTSLFEL